MIAGPWPVSRPTVILNTPWQTGLGDAATLGTVLFPPRKINAPEGNQERAHSIHPTGPYPAIDSG